MLFVVAHKEHELPQTHDLGRAFTHSVVLDDAAPVVHKAFTAEYDDPGRHSPTLIVRTRFRRKGRWHGVRKSWLSIQIKLPTGPRMDSGRWGIVLGWWRYPGRYDWEALVKAIRMGREPDERDQANFELPTRESVSSAVRDISGRRVADPGDVRADGE